MTFDVKHVKISAKVDVPDTSLIRPEAWNSNHKVVVSAGVVGRKANAGNGDPEMLPIYVDDNGVTKFDMKGALKLPTGTVAQRPLVPEDGMMRYNADASRVEVYQAGAWVSLVVVPDSVVPTGTYIYTFAPGAMPGWVVAYGDIGNEGSGAANRANVDCLPLYKMLWENYPQAFVAVTGGRGALAEEDFYANKIMALPDLRETVIAMTGDIGATPNNRLKDGKPGGFGAVVSKGTLGGSKEHKLIAAELAKHQHDIDFAKLVQQNLGGVGGGTQVWTEPGDHMTKIDGGEDTPHNNVQPTMLLNALIKL